MQEIIINLVQNIIKERTYDSYGNILKDTNQNFTIPFGFAGGLHDRDTGLVHFGYREYDPQTGKWTAKDPIDFSGGDSNLYGYVLQDPVNLVDPTGEYWQYIIMGVGVGMWLWIDNEEQNICTEENSDDCDSQLKKDRKKCARNPIGERNCLLNASLRWEKCVFHEDKR